MKTFKTGSYQLKKNKKWIPAGSLFEQVNGRESLNIQGLSCPDKHFDTKEEADQYFNSYCIQKGYTLVEKK